jgi:3-deoxy-D-arabino-heptulosonate 7-phosphate (DAHP) synthase
MKRKLKLNHYTLAFVSLLLALVLSGCGETESQIHDRIMTELDCPVILIAKTDKGIDYHKVVVQDANGRIRTFASGAGDGYKLPNAIAESRNVGDTLKACR